jgi:hypothetical protein
VPSTPAESPALPHSTLAAPAGRGARLFETPAGSIACVAVLPTPDAVGLSAVRRLARFLQ